jgi:dihydropteroate synthase
MHWQTSRFTIDLTQPRIMGIVNVTPDSFSDGGAHGNARAALLHCEQLIKDGADILDIGGESTRPGAQPLSQGDELARVLPVLREAVKLGVPISVDTYKAQVMRAALDCGVDIVNDVWALRQSGAQEAVAAYPRCGVVLMHMHGEPLSMQISPMQEAPESEGGQGGVTGQVLRFLEQQMAISRRHWAKNSQIPAVDTLPDAANHAMQTTRLCIDPGIGFGKTVAQNFTLLRELSQFKSLGCAVLAGWSRKSSLGAVTGLAVGERMLPSVVAAVLAAQQGAQVLRVHDVRDTVAGLKVLAAMQASG